MSESDGGAMITTHRHQSSDGTLRIKTADWKAGSFDFDVIYPDGDTTQVSIRFKTPIGLFPEIASFRGVALASGLLDNTPGVIEYRIPEYSYMLSVPMLMGGQKTEQAKAEATMLASLTPGDRDAYSRFQKEKCPGLDSPIDKAEFERMFRQQVPNADALAQERDAIEEKLLDKNVGEEYGKLKSRSNELCRQLNPPALVSWMFAQMQQKQNECLRKAGVSESGRTTIVEFVFRDKDKFNPCGR
jgi:hypothetical protein